MPGKQTLILALTIGFVFVPLAGAQQADPALPATPPLQQHPYYAGLPTQPIGPNDLIGISVYDSPELSGPVRVDGQGMIRLPMLKQPIRANGLYPVQLEQAVSQALVKGNVLVNPVVTATILQYESRPVSVMGAVDKPLVFQVSHPTTLMEALARAGGLTKTAGPDILVTRTTVGDNGKPIQTTQKIATRDLIDEADPSLNITLQGGDQVLVPEARTVYIMGDVAKPGAFPVQENGGTTVLKMIALAQGLTPDSRKTAYVFRKDNTGKTQEIPIKLSEILKRKSPDVQLQPGDILYIPDNAVKRRSLKMLEAVIPAAAAAGVYGAIIY